MTIHRLDIETGSPVCQHPPAAATTELAEAVDCPHCLDLLRRRAAMATDPRGAS